MWASNNNIIVLACNYIVLVIILIINILFNYNVIITNNETTSILLVINKVVGYLDNIRYVDIISVADKGPAKQGCLWCPQSLKPDKQGF